MLQGPILLRLAVSDHLQNTIIGTIRGYNCTKYIGTSTLCIETYLVTDIAVKFSTDADIVRTAKKLFRAHATSLKYQT